MVKSIVGFGCSWIFGSEIGNSYPGDPHRLENCILGQIGKNLNLPTVNFGEPGSSLTSMLWNFCDWAQNTENISEHLVIVGLTYDNRESWWPEDQSKKTHWQKKSRVELNTYTTTETDDEWTDFVKTYATYSNHDELRAMRYWQTVNFLDSFCYKHNIPLLQINVYRPTKPVQISSLYDSTENMVEMLTKQIPRTLTILLSPGTHPNENGAKVLADIFTEEIHKRKLIK